MQTSNQVVNISSVAGSGTSHTLNNSFDGVILPLKSRIVVGMKSI